MASSQVHGEVRMALEVHAARGPLEADEGEHPATDLEDRDPASERVVLDRPGQAGAEMKHVVPGHAPHASFRSWCGTRREHEEHRGADHRGTRVMPAQTVPHPVPMPGENPAPGKA